MSGYDIHRMKASQLIAQFVIECRSSGLFLPYDDYLVIDELVRLEPDSDRLLLVLAEVLPQWYQKFTVRDRAPPRLRSCLNRLVERIQSAHARNTWPSPI